MRLKTREEYYRIAVAAAHDEADRHMRRNGRKCWNEDDREVAVTEFNRILPEDLDIRLLREEYDQIHAVQLPGQPRRAFPLAGTGPPRGPFGSEPYCGSHERWNSQPATMHHRSLNGSGEVAREVRD